MINPEQYHLSANETREVYSRAKLIESTGRELSRISLKWGNAEDTAAIITTERSKLLIESGAIGSHALISVLTESIARIDYDGPIDTSIIFRREGNPDDEISIDQHLDILGLSRTGRKFDQDSIFTTTPVTGIKILP